MFVDQSAPAGSTTPDFRQLAEAIVHTVAYVDVFDYPLTAAEVHRYLKGLAAPAGAVLDALANQQLVPRRLARQGEYYMLPGREEIAAIRQQRAARAAQLWPLALAYGRQIARLPFVRMVAITGSLAVNNVVKEADVDYLVVTETGRVWLTRAMTILLVRLAARRGVVLCPNYFLAAHALAFDNRSLYAAHELVQMVPLSGADVYAQLRQANRWTEQFLPNAQGYPTPMPTSPLPGDDRAARRLAERLLRTPAGEHLERWEMTRKITKFTRQSGDRGAAEAAFCADWCKGHFDDHGARAMAAFSQRVETLEQRREP